MKIRVHPWHVTRMNKMLTCAGADRLQTGMRGAYGKAQGKVARVHFGSILMSVRVKQSHVPKAREALRRSMFKIAGRQKNLRLLQIWIHKVLKETSYSSQHKIWIPDKKCPPLLEKWSMLSSDYYKNSN